MVNHLMPKNAVSPYSK